MTDAVADHLDQDHLAAFEDAVDSGVFGLGVLFAEVCRGHDIVGAQQAIVVGAEVDKSRVEGGLDLGHDGAVDIAAAETGIGGRNLVAVEGLSVHDGDAHLVGALGVDEHSSSHDISGTAAGIICSTAPLCLCGWLVSFTRAQGSTTSEL